MDIILKQRMVGAIVLISLGVIFIPMFLSGQGGMGSDVKSEIPPLPKYEIKRPQVTEPVRAKLQQGKSQPGQSPSDKPEQKTAVTAQATSQKKPSKTAVSGWIVQVGSFKERKNANQLRDRLRTSGFVAFVEPRKGSTNSYRVKVGPEMKQSQAETLQKQLLEKEKIKGLVKRYPEE